MRPSRPQRRIRGQKPAQPPKKPPVQHTDPVPELYKGETGVLLASGPSLDKDQINYIRPFHQQGLIRVFGLNDTFKICDFLDVFYACDPRWFDHNEEVYDHPCAAKWTQDKVYAAKNKERGLLCVSGSSGGGMSLKPHHIHYGSNSGYQLLNLAYHYGIRKFILLGYNMDVPRGKKQHFFGPHPKPLNQTNNYKGFVTQYDKIQPEIKGMVANCTHPTALTAFRQSLLEVELPVNLLKEEENGSRPTPTPPKGPHPADLPGQEGDDSSDRPVIDPRRY